MMINGDPNVPQDAALEGFAQLGLLTGSFTSWEENPDCQQPLYLENFMRWILRLEDLPQQFGSTDKKGYRPYLGISADGFAFIYYTILQAKKRQGSPLSEKHEANAKTIRETLIHLDISESTLQCIENPRNPHNPYQYPCFEPLIAYLDNYATEGIKGLHEVEAVRRHSMQIRRRRSYIWINNKEDIKQWVTAIKKTLEDFQQLIGHKGLNWPDVEMFGINLECCVFTPRDISQRLPIPDLVNGKTLEPKEREKLIYLVDSIFETARQKALRYLYLSWDLLAIDYWSEISTTSRENERNEESLFYRTMLALWTKWPCDKVWAPPKGSPEEFFSPSFSLDEATSLLTDLLPDVRRYFLLIKEAHQLQLTKQTLNTKNTKTCYPPTFYFADPDHRLSATPLYIKNADVRDLLSTCLGYDDPYTNTLAWSTLEGSMATIRGETVQIDRYKPRYLLLPISARLQDDKEIGADLDSIVDVLSYREYTIALESVKIYDKSNDIMSQKAVNIDTIRMMDHIIHKLARLVPALSNGEREKSIEEFITLQLALGRVQSALEKTKRDAIHLEQQYKDFIERTKKILDKYLTIAPVPSMLFLPPAMMDAYPHSTLREEMRNLPSYIEHLVNSNESISSLLKLLSTAIGDSEKRHREIRNILIAVLGSIIAIASLLGTFFPKVDILSILGNTSSTGQIVLAVVGLTLLVFFFVFFLPRFQSITARSESKRESRNFHKSVQDFWNLAEWTTSLYRREKRYDKDSAQTLPELDPLPPDWFIKLWDDGKEVDAIDDQATLILQRLLLYLESGPTSGEDLVRTMRRLIYIFVLHPERIPLPRTLCILRYKSIKFLEKPTIGYNDFRDSLMCAGFTSNQVNCLQSWLEDETNMKQMRNERVEDIAKALKTAGIEASAPGDSLSENVVKKWNSSILPVLSHKLC